MSCSTTNTLPINTTKASIIRLIELLGYKKQRKVVKEVENYFWYQDDIEKVSLTGVELEVYKNDEGLFEVGTRTQCSRGYWDVEKQYQTTRIVRQYLGGTLQSDYQTGWVKRSEYVKPTTLEYGLYLARARFDVSSKKINIFYSCREMKGQVSSDKPCGFDLIDDINPRFLSNALLIPYCVAIWEDYLKSSYLMILRHGNLQNKNTTKINMESKELSEIINRRYTIEEAITDRLSFQRPRIICQNFDNLGIGLNISTLLKKPYNRRTKNLYDSIDEYVEMRNDIAHTGKSSRYLLDNDITEIAKDFTSAVDRIYKYFGQHFHFEPNCDF